MLFEVERQLTVGDVGYECGRGRCDSTGYLRRTSYNCWSASSVNRRCHAHRRTSPEIREGQHWSVVYGWGLSLRSGELPPRGVAVGYLSFSNGKAVRTASRDQIALGHLAFPINIHQIQPTMKGNSNEETSAHGT